MDKNRFVRKVPIVKTMKDFGSSVIVTYMADLCTSFTVEPTFLFTRLESLAWSKQGF